MTDEKKYGKQFSESKLQMHFKKCKIKLFTLFMFKSIYFIEENAFISCKHIYIILVVASHVYMDTL